MNTRPVALGALILLVGLAGCNGILGPPPADEDALAENASYDWDTDAAATFDLEKSSYTVIYSLENRSRFGLYSSDTLGQEKSIPISSLQFRFPNGTVVGTNDSALTAERGGGETTIVLPGNVSGQLALQSSRRGKTFGVPAHVEGSYEMTLPGGARVGLPILAQVQPGGFETRGPEEGRVTIQWEDVDSNQVRVRWYLQRDLLLFSVLFAGLAAVAGGGALLFYRQVKRLRATREEVGLDVDQEDDDPRDRGPPPGMR